MADPKSFASTYAVASTDKDMLNKRRDLASRLFQAKQAGKTMEEALTSESGVDVRNLQKGSVDTKMGTGLTEEEVAGFAERLYAGKYGGQSATPTAAQGSGSVFDQQEKVAQAASAASGAFGGPNSRGASSQYQAPTPRLDRLAAMQGTPMGSVSIGASGVQGATGGLAKGRSRTGGTPLGGSSTGFSPFGGGTSSAKMMNNIASANLYFAAAERQRQLKEQEAEERGFNRANGNAAPNPMGGIEGGSEYGKMPYFYTQQAK
jgi:hypothetical protein